MICLSRQGALGGPRRWTVCVVEDQMARRDRWPQSYPLVNGAEYWPQSCTSWRQPVLQCRPGRSMQPSRSS